MLLAMTVLALARLAMTSQIAVIARPKAAAIHVRYRPGCGGLAMTVRARLTMTG
jgi:hypothetical protein